MSDNCCSPQSNRKNIEINNSINNPYSNFVSMNNFEQLEGGWFLMGSEEKYVFPGDGEGPVRKIYVDEFSISKYSVTISEFKNLLKILNMLQMLKNLDGLLFSLNNLIKEIKMSQYKMLHGG